eukprot:scaffold649_cov347-Pavlova_lutheri.AAC.65
MAKRAPHVHATRGHHVRRFVLRSTSKLGGQSFLNPKLEPDVLVDQTGSPSGSKGHSTKVCATPTSVPSEGDGAVDVSAPFGPRSACLLDWNEREPLIGDPSVQSEADRGGEARWTKRHGEAPLATRVHGRKRCMHLVRWWKRVPVPKAWSKGPVGRDARTPCGPWSSHKV